MRCRRPLTILPQKHSECRNACGRAKIADIRECSVGSQSRADRCQLGAAPHRRRARRGGAREAGSNFWRCVSAPVLPYPTHDLAGALGTWPVWAVVGSNSLGAHQLLVLLLLLAEISFSSAFARLSSRPLARSVPVCGPRWPLRDSGRPVGRRKGEGGPIIRRRGRPPLALTRAIPLKNTCPLRIPSFLLSPTYHLSFVVQVSMPRPMAVLHQHGT